MKPYVILLLAMASIIPCAQSAEIIPSDRRINWDPGIPGGIPHRTVTYATLNGIDATGATDVRAAIQTALNACPADQVVQLPAGRFRINGGISMPNRVTLRGMGPTTVLDSRGSTAGLVTFGNGGVQWDPTSITTSITAGATAGSTSLTVASASGLSVGTLLVITELNDPAFVTIDATTNPAATWVDGWNTNGTRARGQIVQVTSVSGSTIGISPGLYSAYTRTPWATHFDPQCQWSGVEDLKTSSNNTGTDRNFLFQSAACCWVKNVESDYTDGDHMTLDWSYRCEIRHNYLHDSYVHASGSFDNMIGLRSKSSACLVIDNIIRRLHVSVMCEWGAAGNVIAYNYTEGEFDESAASGNRWLPGGLNLNHGAHPQFNLFEGNITSKFAADSYWGSSSHTTIFRNDILGTGVASPPFTGRGTENLSGAVSLIQGNRAVDIWEVQSQYNIVGNLVGIPALLSRGVVRRVVSPAGRAYDNPPYCFSYGYTSEADGGGTALANPLVTLIEHGNWDVASSVITWDPAITNHVIPDSLFLTAKPAWFGSLAWPPIDPASTSNRSVERIPAGYRYVHGYDPQSVADTTPPTVPAGLIATAASATQITLSWTAATDNVGVVGYRIFRGGTQIGTATGTTYSSTGLSPSTAYSFTVAAYDGATPANVSAQSTVASATTLATTSANHAPVAQAQSVNVSLNTALTITLVATDVDGDALTYAIVTNPVHGTLSGTGTSRTYTPTTRYVGADSFTFAANDGSATSSAAVVAIAVTAIATTDSSSSANDVATSTDNSSSGCGVGSAGLLVGLGIMCSLVPRRRR